MNTPTRLASLLALTLAAACTATADDGAESSTQDLAGVSVTSAYTETAKSYPLDNCVDLESRPNGQESSARYACGAMGGYTLVAEETEETDAVLVKTALGQFTLSLGAPGYPGKLAEWRGKGIRSATPGAPYSGEVDPSALILRYFYSSESAPAQFSGANDLLIIKLSPEGVCLHSTVSGALPNHNQQARDIADSQAFKDFVCPSVTPEPNMPSGCGAVPAGTGIRYGAAVSSCDGSHSLIMQTDGNLVLYNNTNHRATWQSHTAGTLGEAMFVRANGELAVYGGSFDPLFTLPTAGNDGASLAIQGDGNLVMYGATGVVLWASYTQGK